MIENKMETTSFFTESPFQPPGLQSDEGPMTVEGSGIEHGVYGHLILTN